MIYLVRRYTAVLYTDAVKPMSPPLVESGETARTYLPDNTACSPNSTLNKHTPSTALTAHAKNMPKHSKRTRTYARDFQARSRFGTHPTGRLVLLRLNL